MQKSVGVMLSTALAFVVVVGTQCENLSGQQETNGVRRTIEPVFRVPKRNQDSETTTKETNDEKVAPPVEKIASKPADPVANSSKPKAATENSEKVASVAKAMRKPHPLDRALSIAEDGLANIQNNIADYSAIMVKRERVNGKLGDREYMKVKIRNERTIGGTKVPFSVYMNFLKPRACAGREVIWVKGQNDGKLLVHEGGIIGFKTFHLDPTGILAMKGNRYPIYEAGLENLVVKLIEKATRDRNAGDCIVNYREGASINKRSCSVIEVIHPEAKAPFDFHKAQVYIDDEMNIPVRYAAYDWPASAGQPPQLMEEYTYVKVKLNVGLTDMDFDTRNPRYKFPRR